MLPRLLEPEVMDDPLEAADYDAMDHRTVNRAFVDDLLAAAQDVLEHGPANGEVLDLGTGTALIPIELASRHPGFRVTGVDLSRSMLEVAAKNVAAAGFGDRILLRRVDAKRLPFTDGRFACVVCNSIVHHIPLPAEVVREAIRVTAPGGLLFFRDLARPDSLAELERLVSLYAGDANEHQRKMFADSLHACAHRGGNADPCERYRGRIGGADGERTPRGRPRNRPGDIRSALDVA